MVLAYAVRDDAVVAMDITPSYADMHTGLFKYGGGDRCNLLMARVQLLGEYYGCPTGVHGGKTDSCFYNEQTGAGEDVLDVAARLGRRGGHRHGRALENAVTFSPLQLVIDNELVRHVRRAIRSPWIVDGETLAHRADRCGWPGRQLT